MLEDLDINEDAAIPQHSINDVSPHDSESSTVAMAHKRSSGSNVAMRINDISTGGLCEKFEPPDRYNYRIYRTYTLRKLDRCKKLIDELLSKSSESICEYALLTRALIAREEGQIRESMEWLNKIVDSNPSSQRVAYEIGRTYLLLGEHEKAQSYFQKGIETDPNNWRSYYWKAESIYHADSKKEVNSLEAVNIRYATRTQECLLRCPKLNKSVEMLLFIAKTCIQKDDLIPAIEAYKLEPENLEVISHLGLLYLKSGNEEKAFSCLGKALTYDPNHLPSVLAAAAVLQMNGDFDVALTKYRIAASSCDHNGELWNNIGMCFLGKGKLVAAISCLKKANYLCPLDWKILYNLSIVYSAMMQSASAYFFYVSGTQFTTQKQGVLDGDDNDYILRLNCAVFEYKHGDIEESAQMLENLIPPRNIEESFLADLNLLAERLKNCLRRHPQSSNFNI
ncbi:Bardet-Biedl syndrome 4 protein [Aphelenchoides besseyi]|nr:Bardet-Biedl syndrome 4 protein [Aphelenchoides besseyi]